MNLRRIAATLSSTLIIGASYVAPALANSTKRDDGDEPGVGLSTASAILWFVILPVAISAVIALFVLAPGWTKGAKESATNHYLDDPTNRQLGQ